MNRFAGLWDRIVLLAPFLLFPFSVFGQEYTELAESYLEERFNQDQPGVAVVVTKNSQTLYSGAVGMANLELEVPLEADMPFEIASITKQITSASIMMLNDGGALSIYDTVDKYFPDHPSGDATIEELMRNISGVFIPDHRMGSNHVRSDITSDERIELLQSGDPLAEPGSRYIYNNAGYWLLGEIIEQVTGTSYEDFLQENIFNSIGLDQTYYGLHRELIPGRVSGYDITTDGIKNNTYTSVSWAYSAGGLISTATDVAKWSNALFSGDIVSDDSLERMISPTQLPDGTNIPYGFGLVLSEVEDHRAAEHGGGHSGFLVHTTRLLDENIFVVVLGNYFYTTNNFRPPPEKNPATIARDLALMAVNKR